MISLGETLKQFFDTNKRRVSHGELRIAMGNEACDLDSFVSSFVVAYAEDAIHVVNMKKEVFVAKGELMWVCKAFGIDINDLIFLERPTAHFSPRARKIGAYFDVGGVEHPISGKRIKLLLTDHNNPVEELMDCDIELIIDHHIFSGCASPAGRVYVDLDAGSATTLVSKYLGDDLAKKSHCNLRVKGDRAKTSDGNSTLCVLLAKLIIIPILIDTGFLKKRTSELDVFEYKKLKKISKMKKKELKRIIKAIKLARRNDSEYGTNLILQKDFKRFYFKGFAFGGSVVKYQFEDWADREGMSVDGVSEENIGMIFLLQLESFKREMGLDFFFVSTKNKGIRCIIFSGFPFMKSLINKEKFRKVEYKGLEYYHADKKLTRKILVPMMMKLINKYTRN